MISQVKSAWILRGGSEDDGVKRGAEPSSRSRHGVSTTGCNSTARGNSYVAHFMQSAWSRWRSKNVNYFTRFVSLSSMKYSIPTEYKCGRNSEVHVLARWAVHRFVRDYWVTQVFSEVLVSIQPDRRMAPSGGSRDRKSRLVHKDNHFLSCVTRGPFPLLSSDSPWDELGLWAVTSVRFSEQQTR